MSSDYRLTGHRSQVIHKADCPRLAKARFSAGWPWANGKTPEQIAAAYGPTYDRLRFCQACCPAPSCCPTWSRSARGRAAASSARTSSTSATTGSSTQTR
jgi:hypothetical protein